jgi:hypothetical protein
MESVKRGAQDQMTKKVAAAGSQSNVGAHSMMPSSGVTLRGKQKNQDAKVPPQQTISTPMKHGLSQVNPEPVSSKPGDLDSPVSQGPKIDQAIMLAENVDTCPPLNQLLHPPRLSRSPNVQLQDQQPGAYDCHPGGFMQRNDNLSYDLEAPNTVYSAPNLIGQLPLLSGNHQPPIEERVNQLSISLANAGLVEARVVTEESTRFLALPKAQQVDDNKLAAELQLTTIREQKEKECRRVGYCIITVSLAVLAISIGDGLGTRKVDISTTVPTVLPSISPSFAPSSAPTGHLNLLKDGLPQHTQETLKNYSTPQWKALAWLSYHQNIATLPEWRKKQLIALVTFFYAFEGENWPAIIKREWMNGKVDECLWFSSKYGVFHSNGRYEEGESFQALPPCKDNGVFQSLVLMDLKLSNLTPSIPPEVTLTTTFLDHYQVTWEG